MCQTPILVTDWCTAMTMVSFLVIFVIPIVLYIYSKKRGKELSRLSKDGEKTTATISDREQVLRANSKGKTHYRVSYVFKTESGMTITRTVYVSYDVYQASHIGSEVDIVYLVDNPEVSAMSDLVELVRSAIKK